MADIQYINNTHTNPDTLRTGWDKANNNFNILDNHINDTNNPHQVSLEQVRYSNNQVNGDIDMNNNQIKNLGNPADDTDATNKQYVDTISTSLTNHINDTNNPHQVSLEQARSINNQLNGTIDLNGNRIENVADPVNDNDVATKHYVDNNSSSCTGALMADGSVPLTGDLDFNSYKGINLADPTNNTDATNKQYVDSNFVNKTGDVMSGNLNMNSNSVVNLADPTNNTDATNKQYVISQIDDAKAMFYFLG